MHSWPDVVLCSWCLPLERFLAPELVELKGSGESQIIFGDALGSKTSLSKEAKSRFTPDAALAQGLTECAWGTIED